MAGGGRAHPEFLALTPSPDDEMSPGCRRTLIVVSVIIAAAIIITAIVFGGSPG